MNYCTHTYTIGEGGFKAI